MRLHTGELMTIKNKKNGISRHPKIICIYN